MRFLPSALILVACFSVATDTRGQVVPCPIRNTASHPATSRSTSHWVVPPFRFRVEQDKSGDPLIIVSNTNRSPLTAYVEEITTQNPPLEPIVHYFVVVDGLMNAYPLLSPIPYGLSLVDGVSHTKGQPLPKVSLVAATWENGETYGPKEMLQKIIARRMVARDEHQHAIDLLETGLKQGWSLDQYVSAGRSREEELRAGKDDPELRMPKELPLTIVVDNLMRVRRESPGVNLVGFVQQLLEIQLKQKDPLDKSLQSPGDAQDGGSPGSIQ